MLRLSKISLIAFLNFLVLASCKLDDELVPICPTDCWEGEESRKGVGICKSGTPTCDEDGNVISCSGQVFPQEEVCDDRDNDCDGFVDENQYNVLKEMTRSYLSSENTCLQEGECAWTAQTCRDGIWTCEYAEGSPSEEVCDSKDNNCDGEVDNGLNEEIVFCYEGEDPSTATRGACRPGYYQCSAGRVACVGQTLPSPERCDEEDNNCDGFVDNVEEGAEQVDIVLSVDTSGSMSTILETITSVACAYAQTQATINPNFQFALELIATPDGDVSLVQNIGSAQDLCSSLNSVSVNGGSEPTMTANLWTVQSENPLMIGWREGARRVFIGFGDERAQALGCSGDCVGPFLDDIHDSCMESGTLVYWFEEHLDFYVDAAVGCGGDFFFLNDGEDYLLNSLNSIFSGLCAP